MAVLQVILLHKVTCQTSDETDNIRKQKDLHLCHLILCWSICKFNITNNKKENTRVAEGNHVCSVEEPEGQKLN
jgi:hypothetical protein